MDRPGDRRRFVGYARARDISFEIADSSKSYDVVVLAENADVSRWRHYRKSPLIYNLIDSYLARGAGGIKATFRGFAKFATRQALHLELDHRAAVEDLCRRATSVLCSTAEQRADILPFCEDVRVILDLHGEVAGPAKDSYSARSPIRLIWEGLPQNVVGFSAIRSTLDRLRPRRPFDLVLVTDPRFSNRYLPWRKEQSTGDLAERIVGSPVRIIPWRLETLASSLRSGDIGVIPLDLDDAFATGKPENKLLLLWRLGLPVVAAGTPAYRRAMARAGLSTTCSSNAEWFEALATLIDNEDARRQAGEAGRDCAESAYSDDETLRQWDEAVAFAIGARR